MSHEDGGHVFYGLGSQGITRIEYFAAVFGAGMLGTPAQIPVDEAARAAFAQKAFDIAAAFLAERERRFPGCPHS
jgi:hypothetical protein